MTFMVPHTLFGMQEPCNGVPLHVQYDVDVVTVNDWNLVMGSPTCMISFECGNLVTVNDGNSVMRSPTCTGNLVTVNDGNLVRGSPSHLWYDFFITVNDWNLVMGSPTCTGNLVTANDRNLISCPRTCTMWLF